MDKMLKEVAEMMHSLGIQVDKFILEAKKVYLVISDSSIIMTAGQKAKMIKQALSNSGHADWKVYYREANNGEKDFKMQ